jgi:CRP-like cAMP-binding protein
MVACNLAHPIEARLPRLLLTVRDRAGADQFDLTQGTLAEMIGASRQTVTVVAGGMQAAGLIAYHRGRVRVLDPAGLEARACECYRVMRDFYDQVFG